ncbi:heat shock 22 kDa protein, mitochondrial-like isoform X2 [Diospyros lotus]|uniref:heat shock 22 kDa protein, mitochondrial-like isoform X2 n=1 Tax=Diospyros lotus TaxID=55363 RepID=UPI002259E43C|nr:heat shock 22 kDa protein, mitochondrial-like isoform X2 [Diospyros lotus]
MVSASLFALRRAAAAKPLFFNRLRSASALLNSPGGARSFATDTQLTRHDDYDDGGVDVDRRSVSRRRDSIPSLFSVADAFDPFSPTRSLSQVLNLVDQLMDSPLRGMSGGPRRGWDVKEEDDALYLRVDMPGLGKENVKVSVEQNTLIIKGEGEKESEAEEFGPRYSSRLDLPPDLYQIDQIKAEMKNGVLKVVVPKVREGERKDAIQVKVD